MFVRKISPVNKDYYCYLANDPDVKINIDLRS